MARYYFTDGRAWLFSAYPSYESMSESSKDNVPNAGNTSKNCPMIFLIQRTTNFTLLLAFHFICFSSTWVRLTIERQWTVKKCFNEHFPQVWKQSDKDKHPQGEIMERGSHESITIDLIAVYPPWSVITSDITSLDDGVGRSEERVNYWFSTHFYEPSTRNMRMNFVVHFQNFPKGAFIISMCLHKAPEGSRDLNSIDDVDWGVAYWLGSIQTRQMKDEHLTSFYARKNFLWMGTTRWLSW